MFRIASPLKSPGSTVILTVCVSPSIMSGAVILKTGEYFLIFKIPLTVHELKYVFSVYAIVILYSPSPKPVREILFSRSSYRYNIFFRTPLMYRTAEDLEPSPTRLTLT